MVSRSHTNRLEDLFQIGLNEAMQHRQQRFKDRISQLKEPLLLWGCGPLGSRAAQALKKTDLKVTAFIDRNSERWGETFEGVPVISPESVRNGSYPDALVIIAVYSSEPLRKLLEDWKIPFLTFPELAWGMPDLFLPHCALDYTAVFYEEKEAVRQGLEVWADDASREEYLGQLQWRLTMDYDALPPHLPAIETYFPTELVALQPNEHYVDCGAFDGDSIRELLKRTNGQFNRITAFEPDARNYLQLKAYMEELPSSISSRMELINKGLGDEIVDSFIDETGTVASTIGETGSKISVVTLDSVLVMQEPTYIKMDIEGFEPFALKGASEIIQKHHPVLAVCLYHAFNHLWTIPHFLHQLAPDYSLYLRRHSDECWESVCYAIPRSRLRLI